MSIATHVNVKHSNIGPDLKIFNKVNYEDAMKICLEYFDGDELAASVFLSKYALRDNDGDLVESVPTDMHIRIAKELARIEEKKFREPLSFDRIFSYLDRYAKIMPQGSPCYGIGNPYTYVSISNCFVVDSPVDSYGGILHTDQQLIQISKRRGGVGTDLSHIRPAKSLTKNSSRTSTGVIPFMQRYSNSIREVGQDGRRGALMLSISVHHPEVLEFAQAKNDKTKVTGANISVRNTNEFLDAVDKDEMYEQRWPVNAEKPTISKKVRARDIWDALIHNAWLRAEPGLLFWDLILDESPADCYSYFGFNTVSTNPCGELPLCALDSCRLLCLNLYTYVKNKFTSEAYFDFEEFYKDVQVAQRLMDDIVDLELEAVEKIIDKINNDPEEESLKKEELDLWKRIWEMAYNGRRTGLGITALGDAIAGLNIKYGSEESIEVTERIYKTLKLGSYRSSVDMAKEKGPFPIWDWQLEKNNPFINRIKDEDPQLYADIKKYGRRNIANLTTAPVGSGSTQSQSTSGIEPIFDYRPYDRRKKINPGDTNTKVDFVDATGDKWQIYKVYHKPLKDWMRITGENDISKSPYHGSTANDLDWKNRVRLQAAAQRHVDHSISSTVNLPEDVTEDKISEIYLTAWKAGCKGITVYRDKCRDGVLISNSAEKPLSDKIIHTKSPKRPTILPADIHHTKVKGEVTTVLVGLLNEDPYEVMVIHGHISGEKGKIVKVKRGHYNLLDLNDEIIYEDINKSCTDNEDALTRLASTALRHGSNMKFICEQLGKVKGDFMSFSKGIARVLKKYIPDGSDASGATCPNCNSTALVYTEGCQSCRECGFSKCS